MSRLLEESRTVSELAHKCVGVHCRPGIHAAD